MCESCSGGRFDRREFLAGGALGAASLLSATMVAGGTAGSTIPAATRDKKPARVMAAFLYPPADVVNAGEFEDPWREHHWFTWPGNQFEPEQQERKFTQKIKEMADSLGIEVEFCPRPIYQKAKMNEFIETAKAKKPDAVLIVNFWNTLSPWAFQMTRDTAPTAIVYHALGSNHQLPREYLRTAEGLYYIHSIENWSEIERGLRAVRAKKMIAQSRLLRVSGKLIAPAQAREKFLDLDIVGIPAEEFNSLFDSIKPDDAMIREAEQFKKQAMRVMDVTDEYFVEAFRAHRAVGEIVRRYEADAVTIECLFLKHRKPCVSFAINNGSLIPSGCENHLDATLTMMLGRWLLERAGFQHNPEFDTSENHYFASHCTCAWKLRGPQGSTQNYMVRPFFHQLPKSAALDVQWTPGEPVLVAKYLSGEDTLACWTGKVLHSPSSPPVGGCATRVLLDIDNVPDVCDIYSGAHPVLFCGDRSDARRLKAFARMYRLQFDSNL